jgi:hypothetical protein
MVAQNRFKIRFSVNRWFSISLTFGFKELPNFVFKFHRFSETETDFVHILLRGLED